MYPLVGRLDRNRCTLGLVRISIHAPLAGCDPWPYPRSQCPRHFNPRTPCGVRLCSIRCTRRTSNFNPRTPCGVRPTLRLIWIGWPFQSTHPLRGATGRGRAVRLPGQFQSTHPLRGATPLKDITIDAVKFQSTHPLRGATSSIAIPANGDTFQSTHPLRGATRLHLQCMSLLLYFNPRTPCGVRPCAVLPACC